MLYLRSTEDYVGLVYFGIGALIGLVSTIVDIQSFRKAGSQKTTTSVFGLPDGAGKSTDRGYSGVGYILAFPFYVALWPLYVLTLIVPPDPDCMWD
jgi:hypothetical protein